MSIILELVRPVPFTASAYSEEKALQLRVKKNASDALLMLRTKSVKIASDAPLYQSRLHVSPKT